MTVGFYFLSKGIVKIIELKEFQKVQNSSEELYQQLHAVKSTVLSYKLSTPPRPTTGKPAAVSALILESNKSQPDGSDGPDLEGGDDDFLVSDQQQAAPIEDPVSYEKEGNS